MLARRAYSECLRNRRAKRDAVVAAAKEKRAALKLRREEINKILNGRHISQVDIPLFMRHRSLHVQCYLKTKSLTRMLLHQVRWLAANLGYVHESAAPSNRDKLIRWIVNSGASDVETIADSIGKQFASPQEIDPGQQQQQQATGSSTNQRGGTRQPAATGLRTQQVGFPSQAALATWTTAKCNSRVKQLIKKKLRKAQLVKLMRALRFDEQSCVANAPTLRATLIERVFDSAVTIEIGIVEKAIEDVLLQITPEERLARKAFPRPVRGGLTWSCIL